MTHHRLRLLVPLCTVIALSCGCSKPAPDASPATSTNAMDGLMATVESASEAAGDERPGGDAALKPGERVQGTLQLDIGNGAAAYRSLATKIDDDLGKKTAERLGTAAGQQDLAGAKSSVGGGAKVSSQDVQELADAFAGKTMYTSQMYSFAIINQRQIELAGIAADGRRATLVIKFPLDSDVPKSASLEYVPNGRKRMQTFETERKADDAVQVTMDRFERVDDDTVSVAGTFSSGTLKPGVMAKDLAGQEIASASGRFDFTEVNVRADK